MIATLLLHLALAPPEPAPEVAPPPAEVAEPDAAPEPADPPADVAPSPAPEAAPAPELESTPEPEPTPAPEPAPTPQLILDPAPETTPDPAEPSPPAEEEPREYLLEGRERKVTGYGGLRLRPTAVGNDFGFLIGGGGAAVFGGRFILGGEGYGMAAFAGDVGTRMVDGEREKLGLQMGYGGLRLGWLFDRPGMLDVSIQALLGGGGVSLAAVERDDAPDVDSTGMFIAEPEAVLYVRIAKMFRLGVSAGYRFIAHGQWSGPSGFGLMGPSGAIVFDWGSF